MAREIAFSDGIERHAAFVLDGDRRRTILVLPDWRGCRAGYAMRRAAELSREFGCNVILGDLYGTAYRPARYDGDAELWVSRALADPVALRGRLALYLRALADEAGLAPDGIMAVGYCLGGALAFEMGRAGCGLSAVACVHGIPSSTAPVTQDVGKTRFVAIHGGSDPIIGMEHLAAFQREMTDAGADWVSISLGQARHGYTDEEGDPHGAFQRYDPTAARRSLEALKIYLREDDVHDA